MYHFKAENEAELKAERLDLVWRMLAAQLEASHERLMAQYGMDVVRPAPEEEDSPLRGPRRRYNAAQLPAPQRKAGPLRGS